MALPPLNIWHEAIASDNSATLIYADWLEDQGQGQEAAQLRIIAAEGERGFSDSYGYGHGYGYGYGDGYGYGYGDGHGYGYGDGYGHGDGYGYGHGYGDDDG